MAKDERPYVQMDVGLPNSRKLRSAPVDAKWLYAATLLWCGLEINDGIFRPRQATAYADVEDEYVQVLIDRDLWHQKGHACPKCPQPAEDGDLVVHDYFEHNRSADLIRKLRTDRRAAARKGNHERWQAKGHKDHQAVYEDCEKCN